MGALPSYGLFDDLDDLAGETVVEAGDLEQLRCPINGNYDCLTWPTAFYKLGSYCVEAVGAYSIGYGGRGILTTNSSGQNSLFVVGSISSDFTRHPVKLYDCPSKY